MTIYQSLFNFLAKVQVQIFNINCIISFFFVAAISKRHNLFLLAQSFLFYSCFWIFLIELTIFFNRRFFSGKSEVDLVIFCFKEGNAYIRKAEVGVYQPLERYLCWKKKAIVWELRGEIRQPEKKQGQKKKKSQKRKKKA